MLESAKISQRQSKIRQELAALAAKENPDENEIRQMSEFEAEYQKNEVRYRAALVSEDSQRKAAGADLETRENTEWNQLVSSFELRQVIDHYVEKRALSGQTLEVVSELRSHGKYAGVPVPFEALEIRANETIASGVLTMPKYVAPIVERIFAPTVAARMGIQFINITSGSYEVPIVTSAVTAGWQATELGNVPQPAAFATTSKSLGPNQTLGVQMRISRKSLLQAGQELENAIRRDMNSCILVQLDKSLWLGAGSSGEPLGIVTGQSTYAYTTTAITAKATYDVFLTELVAFLNASAAASFADVKILARAELQNIMDNTAALLTSTSVTQWDRLLSRIPVGNIVNSPNAVAAPTGSPVAITVVLMTNTGGVAPFMVGMYGALDVISDVYTDAQSGGLRLTGLLTADINVLRPAQTRRLTAVQVA
jgi:HK97 family phage major capsid protein